MVTDNQMQKFTNLIRVCNSIKENTRYLNDVDFPVLQDLTSAECFDTAFDLELLRLYNHIRIQENVNQLRREGLKHIPLPKLFD